MATFKQRTYDAPDELEATTESGTKTELWRLEADSDSPALPTLADVHDKIEEILGSTGFPVSTVRPGGIDRVLPRACASYQNMYAYNVKVAPVRDTDSYEVKVADPLELLEAPPLPHYVQWNAWDFTIKFAPRPYALVSDNSIGPIAYAAYADDGTTYGAAYYPEWLRYTDIRVEPRSDDLLKAKAAKMAFMTGDGSPPNGRFYQGLATMPLGLDNVFVDWYAVPYRYVRSAASLLRRFKYRVNQDEWEGYQPGELLYKGFSVKRYSPPMAETDPDWGGEFSTVFSSEKLCNITLEMVSCAGRVTTNPPAYVDLGGTVPNRNWIIGGHNALPNFRDRLFYYTPVVDADPALRFPSYLSVPFHRLFQDPDVGGA